MFHHEMREKMTNTVRIDDYETAVVKTAVSFMYNGYIDGKSTNDYNHLVRVALFGQKYSIRDLVKACFEQIHLQANVENVVNIFRAIHDANFDDISLQENLTTFICL